MAAPIMRLLHPLRLLPLGKGSTHCLAPLEPFPARW